MTAPALEIYAGVEFLYSYLAADNQLYELAPGGVNRGLAPPGAIAPWVIIGFMAGSNSLTIVGVRVMVSALYQAKVVGPASITPTLAAASAEIDAVLGGKNGLRNISTPDGYIAACYQETPIFYDDPQPINGEMYSNIGGIYRILIEQMS